MKQLIILLSVLLLSACNEKTTMQETTTHAKETAVVVVNETDPVCEMSVKEHLSDTALINGEVWGFCSPVCKEKYLETK